MVTPYQRIDIWDTKELGETPSHDDVIKHNLQKGDPRLLTTELTSPSRMFFLDGTAQVSLLTAASSLNIIRSKLLNFFLLLDLFSMNRALAIMRKSSMRH